MPEELSEFEVVEIEGKPTAVFLDGSYAVGYIPEA
jgi:hypothetical protein